MDQHTARSGRRPVIVGIGGTMRPDSTTERALALALDVAERAGASTELLGGSFLATLPIFDPRPGGTGSAQARLVAMIAKADGIIIATPGYHGAISGVVKNALDTLELGRDAPTPYLSGKPVGTIVTVAGSQAGGTCLMTLRAIIHALRGWPTPFGAVLNSGMPLFDDAGACCNEKDSVQLFTVADQVVEFARMKAALQSDRLDAAGPPFRHAERDSSAFVQKP